MNTIEISNITKSYRDQKALDGLSLNVPDGIIFGITGPNGAGKSTTVNCITGLASPDSGIVSVFGRLIDGDSMDVRRRIGVLFENTENLFIYLKAEEQLIFTGEIFGMKRSVITQRIDELMKFFAIEDHRYKLIADYSRGMKKKLGLASMFLHDPELMILDEPFEGLDTFTVIRLKNLLRSLRDKGKTVFITSHMLAYIEDTCDEVAIINKGKLVFQAPTGKIRSIVKNEISQKTYNSLEEVFLDLTIHDNLTESLSWL